MPGESQRGARRILTQLLSNLTKGPKRSIICRYPQKPRVFELGGNRASRHDIDAGDNDEGGARVQYCAGSAGWSESQRLGWREYRDEPQGRRGDQQQDCAAASQAAHVCGAAAASWQLGRHDGARDQPAQPPIPPYVLGRGLQRRGSSAERRLTVRFAKFAVLALFVLVPTSAFADVARQPITGKGSRGQGWAHYRVSGSIPGPQVEIRRVQTCGIPLLGIRCGGLAAGFTTPVVDGNVRVYVPDVDSVNGGTNRYGGYYSYDGSGTATYFHVEGWKK